MPTTFYQHKSRFKKFLIKMQSYGSVTEWSDVNFDVEKYLVSIRHDPYFIDSMRTAAITSINTVLENEPKIISQDL